mgnify:CR=1 FL=1
MIVKLLKKVLINFLNRKIIILFFFYKKKKMDFTINPKTGRKIKIHGDTFYDLIGEGYEWNGTHFVYSNEFRENNLENSGWMEKMVKDIRKYDMVKPLKAEFLKSGEHRARLLPDYDPKLVKTNDESIIFMLASIDQTGILTKAKKFYSTKHSDIERELYITKILIQ